MEIKIDKQLIDDAVQQAVKEIKEQYVWIPKDGLTNGEVIKALFPDISVNIIDRAIFSMHDGYGSFDKHWWNAPYKAESEE